MKTCPRCGKELEDSAASCSYCGEGIELIKSRRPLGFGFRILWGISAIIGGTSTLLLLFTIGGLWGASKSPTGIFMLPILESAIFIGKVLGIFSFFGLVLACIFMPPVWSLIPKVWLWSGFLPVVLGVFYSVSIVAGILVLKRRKLGLYMAFLLISFGIVEIITNSVVVLIQGNFHILSLIPLIIGLLWIRYFYRRKYMFK